MTPQVKKIQILGLTFLQLSLLSTVSLATGVTNSEKYQWLEEESLARTRFIGASNGELNLALKTSENKKKLEDFFRKRFANPLPPRELIFGNKVLKVINQGLGKGTEMVLVNDDKSEEKLFSTLELAKKGSFKLLDFKISPNNKYFLLQLIKDGSTDFFNFRVFDFEKRSLLAKSMDVFHGSAEWGLENNLNVKENETGKCLRVKLPDFEVTTSECELKQPLLDWHLANINGKFNLTRKSDGVSVELAGSPEMTVISKDYLYYTAHVWTGISGNPISKHIFRVSLLGAPSHELFYQGTENYEGGLQFGAETAIIPVNWAGRQKLKIVDVKSKLEISTIVMPEFSNYFGSYWITEKQTLRVYLGSHAMLMKAVDYNLTTNSFDQNALQDLLILEKSKKPILSQIIQVTSQDGTQIPVRITHLKSMPLNNQNPVYFHVYGGFGVSNFSTTHDRNHELFLELGGVLVSAAVRGGNEFGYEWQRAAQAERKMKTFEDVASVAKYLSASGYTNPSKIILTGGSNGGMVVAATAQAFPGTFGLVIPRNGVHDMLRRNVLDSKMNNGWSFEYGDLTDQNLRNSTMTFSPVETAGGGPGANYLIICGREDSRVNPAHSYKLKASLSESNTSKERFVYLTSLNNAGHSAESIPFQDYIGWRVQVVMWSVIYDYLGVTLPEIEQ